MIRTPPLAVILPHRFIALAVLLVGLIVSSRAAAHPMVENAADVEITRTAVIVKARISPEQVAVVEGGGKAPAASDEWEAWVKRHGKYVSDRLLIEADGIKLQAKTGESADGAIATATTLPTTQSAGSGSSLIAYRFEYPMSRPPEMVTLRQTWLLDKENWSAMCVLRIRQSGDPAWDAAMLRPRGEAEYGCVWPKEPPPTTATTAPVEESALPTKVRIWPTVREYLSHGVMHILTGVDHLLFVSALTLAAVGVWELFKVVTAFTIAHTLTLVLSVLGVARLNGVSEHIVEPMIAASIVFVAVQNVIWPKSSRGRVRLAIAFAFGLFHGLGFAGGLRDAMADLPTTALGVALASFSIGVEVGHQVVVIPLFAMLFAARRWRKVHVPEGIMGHPYFAVRFGSAAIAGGGLFFLISALRG